MRKMVSVLAVLGFVLSTTVALADGTTSLEMSGPAGEYITQGQVYDIQPTDGGAFAADKNYRNGVHVWFTDTKDINGWWNLYFAAPNNALLTPGLYPYAQRFSFGDRTAPGLDVSGEGRGCNTICGSFRVYEITYGPGDTIESFWADFTQNCECLDKAMAGTIKFNAHATPVRPTSWGAIKSLYRR